jgi:hypothetical protein
LEDAIRFVLGNFTLTFLVLGFIAAGAAILLQPGRPTLASASEALLAYFIQFSISLSFFYNFVFHVFFGRLAAGYIGWADSPFQAEVGYASLGFAAVGIIAFKGGCRVRLAAILGPALFQWGAAVGHIEQIVSADNLAPGNAGVMLYSDILLPVVGLALLWFRRKAEPQGAASMVAARAIRG